MRTIVRSRRRATAVLAAIAAAVLLVMAGLWAGRGSDRTSAHDTVTEDVRVVEGAASPRGIAAPSDLARADAALVQHVRQVAGTGGTVVGDIRVVDSGRQIACGVRTVGNEARPRRFVWIGGSETLVTDGGGPDFAILVRVCDPARPGVQ